MKYLELIKCEGNITKRVNGIISVTDKILNIKSNDFTPLNIGFENVNGLMSIIIPANSPIPLRKRETFIITPINKMSTTITLLQGLSKEALENIKLFRFTIYYISKEISHEVYIEVIFEIDIYGILRLSTENNKCRIQVDEYFNGLSREEIQKIILSKKVINE